MVLSLLDFQSISRFSRVSALGRTVVESLPAYNAVMSHAPAAVAALGRTNLLSLHSVSQLLETMRSERCALCPEYGAFLFLPTCKRSCWQCLQFNASMRLITSYQARRFLGLTTKHLQRLHIVHTIPGIYGLARKQSTKSYQLFSASEATELAVSVYGSSENLIARLNAKVTPRKPWLVGKFLLGAASQTSGGDSLMVPDQGNHIDDKYFGMASIPFPSIVSGTVDRGFWCKGCRWMHFQARHGQLDPSVFRGLAPRGCHPSRILLGLTRRARSRTGFLRHVEQCYGGKQLYHEKTVDVDSM